MGEHTLTERNQSAWAHLDPKWRELRMFEWAQMLEKRVKELDPQYEAYPWGRRDMRPAQSYSYLHQPNNENKAN